MLIDPCLRVITGEGFLPHLHYLTRKKNGVFQQVVRLKTRYLPLPAPFWARRLPPAALGPGRPPAAAQIYQRLQRRSFPWNQTDCGPARQIPSASVTLPSNKSDLCHFTGCVPSDLLVLVSLHQRVDRH
jgi:hypothetical protein